MGRRLRITAYRTAPWVRARTGVLEFSGPEDAAPTLHPLGPGESSSVAIPGGARALMNRAAGRPQRLWAFVPLLAVAAALVLWVGQPDPDRGVRGSARTAEYGAAELVVDGVGYAIEPGRGLRSGPVALSGAELEVDAAAGRELVAWWATADGPLPVGPGERPVLERSIVLGAPPAGARALVVASVPAGLAGGMAAIGDGRALTDDVASWRYVAITLDPEASP